MGFIKLISLIVLSISMIACGGGGSSGSDRGSDRDTDNSVETPDTDPQPDSPVVVSNFAFFPVVRGATWYYSNGDEVTFGANKLVAGETIAPLVHSSPGWAAEEYLFSDEGRLYFAGLFLNALDLTALGLGEVSGEVAFSLPWRIYTPATDSGSGGILPVVRGAVLTTVPQSQEIGLDLTLRSSVSDKEAVYVPQFGDVPSVRLDLELGILLVGSIHTSIWVSPGLGIVARQNGDNVPENTNPVFTLDHVTGLQAPVIFIFNQGDGLAQTPKQLIWDGSLITDNQWQVSIDYATEESDWLNVEFDSSGTWRASLVGGELPEGLHAATVALTQGNETRELVISVLVQ